MPHPLQPFFDDDGKTISLRRETETSGSDMGSQFTWTTAARGTLPTSLTGVIQPARSGDIAEAMQRGIDITHNVYFLSNPQVDARDRMYYTDTLGVEREFLVKSKLNYDERDELFKIMVLESQENTR